MIRIILILSLFAFPLLAQDSTQIHEFQVKIKRYLDKNNALSDYYLISSEGISIYASKEKKEVNETEFHLSFQQIPNFNRLYKNLPKETLIDLLSKKSIYSTDTHLPEAIELDSWQVKDSNQHLALEGKKIVLDPGHIAGTFETARLERKYVYFKEGTEGLDESIKIIEGRLTLQTAQVLRKLLEDDGASVYLTRQAYEMGALNTSFDNWLNKNFKNTVDSLFQKGKLKEEEKTFFLEKAGKREIFRKLFNPLDLEERANKINMINPDISIMIHYNVDEKNMDWKKPTGKNYNMAFVGGSFLANELSTKEDRFEFLRLLVSDDLENSIELCAAIMKGFDKHLKVERADSSDATYLKEYSMNTETPGVYARNLSMTRNTHGILCFGETLYQDNLEECQNLYKEEVDFKGITNTSQRVIDVAKGYHEGILMYFKQRD